MQTTITVTKRSTQSTENRPRVLATFVIDVSGSMMLSNRLNNAMKGAQLIFNEVLWDSDRIEIINFSNKAFRQLHLKSKRNVDWDREANAIARERSGCTALYDACHKALLEMTREKKYHNCHRELIVLTDGEDNASSTTMESIRERLNNPEFKQFHCSLIGVELGPNCRAKEIVNNKHSTYIPCKEEEILSSFHLIKKAVFERIEQTTIRIKNANKIDIMNFEKTFSTITNTGVGSDGFGNVYNAVGDFKGTQKSDLWFRKGEPIQVFEKDLNTGRWRGENVKTKKNGWFPSNLVQLNI
ncbi:hypothetical protein AKO1_006589 [Acrasis kona]|uniref:VWFA domain-containing protein n=1 Tax=Acrasis kona TaxID=1008807 RepID=A0AAW2ZK59_9EUKA